MTMRPSSEHSRARREERARAHAAGRRPVRDRAAGVHLLRPDSRREAGQARGSVATGRAARFCEHCALVEGFSFSTERPGPLRRDGRAGDRAQLELLRLVRGRARRVPRAATRAATSGCATSGSRRSCSRRTSATSSRRGSTTGCVVHARCLDVKGARFRYEYAIERDGRRDRRRLDGARDGRRSRRFARPASRPGCSEAIASAESTRSSSESSPS